MEIIHSKLTVYLEQVEIFKERLQDIVDEARLLDGCLLFDWYSDPVDINVFIIYGEFKDEMSYKVYKESHVLDNINRELFPLLSVEPVFKQIRGKIILSHNVK